MLIVTRSLRQSVLVGEFDGLELMLKVTVLGIDGKKVRLGFEVLPEDPGSPSEAWEQFGDSEPNPRANDGIEATYVSRAAWR